MPITRRKTILATKMLRIHWEKYFIKTANISLLHWEKYLSNLPIFSTTPRKISSAKRKSEYTEKNISATETNIFPIHLEKYTKQNENSTTLKKILPQKNNAFTTLREISQLLKQKGILQWEKYTSKQNENLTLLRKISQQIKRNCSQHWEKYLSNCN